MLLNKTKKNKSSLSKSKKQQLWNEFETEVSKKEDILECLDETYSDELCNNCNSILALSEEGYLTCTNKNCGIVYTNMLNQGEEWNHYPEDTHSGKSNPSRCGAPINEMLKEMSFSCQIICGGKSSYEMRKINRYVACSVIQFNIFSPFYWFSNNSHSLF